MAAEYIFTSLSKAIFRRLSPPFIALFFYRESGSEGIRQWLIIIGYKAPMMINENNPFVD